MTDRISRTKIDARIDYLNRLTGSPAEPYTKGADGQWSPNPGNFHLEGAHGGYKLARMAGPNGASSDPLCTGYVSLRALYDAIDCYIRALEDVQSGRVSIRQYREAA